MGQGKARGKGGRRAYLSKYSSTIIGGSSGIDKHYFREMAQRAHALNHKDIAFVKLFGLDNTRETVNKARATAGLPPSIHESPRDKVLRKLSEVTNGLEPTHNVCLVPRQMYMFWAQGYYIVVKYDTARSVIKRSYRYSSREDLMFAFENNCIKWKDEPDPSD